MTTMNMIQALNDAHKVMMARDEDIVVFGEDIGFFGGVFRVTEGLQKAFGKTRVFDAPISEGGIISTAVGMATYGLKPLIEKAHAAIHDAQEAFRAAMEAARDHAKAGFFAHRHDINVKHGQPDA